MGRKVNLNLGKPKLHRLTSNKKSFGSIFPGKSCLGPGEGGRGGDAGGGFGFSFDFSLDLASIVSTRDFRGVLGPTDFLLFIISSICEQGAA